MIYTNAQHNIKWRLGDVDCGFVAACRVIFLANTLTLTGCQIWTLKCTVLSNFG